MYDQSCVSKRRVSYEEQVQNVSYDYEVYPCIRKKNEIFIAYFDSLNCFQGYDKKCNYKIYDVILFFNIFIENIIRTEVFIYRHMSNFQLPMIDFLCIQSNNNERQLH